MSEQHFTRITINATRSYYSEQEIAEYSRLELHILRQLSESGVIPATQIVGEEARYSDEDLVLLRRARRLYEDLGVNLEGIEIILRLLLRLDALQRELDNARKTS
jgi:MerR family transcriptional regulator/heat shock protein HspR